MLLDGAGSVALTISGSSTAIWKDAEKGGENLVLSGPGTRVWDLSDAGQRSDWRWIRREDWKEANKNAGKMQ